MASRKDLGSPAKFQVCLITGTFPLIRCGIGDYTAKLASALADAGGRVSVITSERAITPGDKRVEVAAIVPGWNWSGLRRVMGYLLAEQPEVVHFQYPTALYGRHPAITLLPWLVRLAGLLKAGWSPRCIITIHEYATFRLAGKIRIWAMALACQTIIAVSPQTLRSLRPLRFLGKALAHLPIGSNITTELPAEYTQDPESWQHKHGLKTDRPVIAYFGFISPSKGLPALVEAFSRLEQEAQLLLIAEPKAQDANYQAYFDDLNSLIKAKKLEQKIRWTGFADEAEVAAYLHSATIAVFPYTDGVSLRRTSLLAALANGVPTISTFPSSPHDAAGLVDGENIWLVPAENSARLSQVLTQLMADPGLRSRLGAAGQRLASQLGWPEIALSHLKLYKRRG